MTAILAATGQVRDTATATAAANEPVWGGLCEEDGWERGGLVQRHAINAVAKHNRDKHQETLDLHAAAVYVLDIWENRGHNPNSANQSYAVVRLWVRLMGVAEEEEGVAMARHYAENPATAAVAPF